MAAVIDICNLALSHLGDEATVASIDPPEGSPQATHCARFYPIARDALLELHNWAFSMTRAELSLLSATPLSGWDYAYAMPSDAISILAIFAAGATDDSAPQPFETETLADGTKVIYTDTASAVCRYTRSVTDPSRYSPLFTLALSWLLASHLAGPVLKGESGTNEAKRCLGIFQATLAQGTTSDASQRNITMTQTVSWMGGR